MIFFFNVYSPKYFQKSQNNPVSVFFLRELQLYPFTMKLSFVVPMATKTDEAYISCQVLANKLLIHKIFLNDKNTIKMISTMIRTLRPVLFIQFEWHPIQIE